MNCASACAQIYPCSKSATLLSIMHTLLCLQFVASEACYKQQRNSNARVVMQTLLSLPSVSTKAWYKVTQSILALACIDY